MKLFLVSGEEHKVRAIKGFTKGWYSFRTD
jgi:hypothetical protein